jgi:hypothetical protein
MQSPSPLKSRLKAGALHLGISAAIALAAAALIFLVWYPAPLFTAQGVSRIVLLLIAVDVAIGPLITVIIFNRAKKSLRADLAVIATLQLSALLYGLHAIFSARPALLVFNIDRFEVVTALDVDTESLNRARAAGHPGLSGWRPRVVAALLPTDRKERNKLLLSAVQGGADLAQSPEWYVPYETTSDEIRARIRPLSELRGNNGMTDSGWRDFLLSLDRPESQMGYLPLRAKVHDGAVIVDSRTAEIVKITLLEPKWN